MILPGERKSVDRRPEFRPTPYFSLPDSEQNMALMGSGVYGGFAQPYWVLTIVEKNRSQK
jgi:hypothetical protein